ncbi:hypothetical protein [Methanobacterium congolense]|uniref:Uncharacterized protein n=1 Tax=Methanobacterium congolense TaxID=118062 RepID=A0A1D3L5K6_9EURY|nr:hypothetical protein [Methanobacterium congolense]SCG86904.1 putative protein [Methanobacterium congolense]
MGKSKDYEAIIKGLELKLKEKEFEIQELRVKLQDKYEMLQDRIEEKKILEKRLEQFELNDATLKMGKLDEVTLENHKLEHRVQVTKKQLDEARGDLKFQERVIEDLENRGFLDFLLKRVPKSFREYKKP